MTTRVPRVRVGWLAWTVFVLTVSTSRPGVAAQNPAVETERARIRAHLSRVETKLRETNTRTLSPALRRERARNLDRLHAYWLRGEFPRNESFPGERVPHFIDRDGRVCAVGHLIVASGHRELAESIAHTRNNAKLADIQRADLDEWIAHSGLSREEHAMIQPSYSYTPTCVTQCVPTEYVIATTVAFVWSLSLATANTLLLAQHRSRLAISVFGLLAGAVSVVVGIGGVASATTSPLYGDNPPLRGVGITNVAIGALSLVAGALSAALNRSRPLLPCVAVGAMPVPGDGLQLLGAVQF